MEDQKYFGLQASSTPRDSSQQCAKKLPGFTKGGHLIVSFVRYIDLQRKHVLCLSPSEFGYSIFTRRHTWFSPWRGLHTRTVPGRCWPGPKNWKTCRIKTKGSLWTNASDLYVCHQHNCRERCKVIILLNISEIIVLIRLYECPIYRKPARTDLNYIGSIDFESDIGPRHWTMRGVALLCDIK